jgi:hypothetical protein
MYEEDGYRLLLLSTERAICALLINVVYATRSDHAWITATGKRFAGAAV